MLAKMYNDFNVVNVRINESIDYNTKQGMNVREDI